ncbi:hypothetical protein UA32_12365 [Photobacterium angustum]|uniref:Uncharacterized protein n=1 Tax=Photobacterium angustum TaxID=661 RepID=A0ABX5GYI1_PHOAN|nr:hypothetical protein [Photobacterium angustum]KJG37743.1 hypothetical protein UA32_12365 [Photobacterium angustum]PSX03921.1 hypothetical protein C0W27_20715 [Photobacterium angustum]
MNSPFGRQIKMIGQQTNLQLSEVLTKSHIPTLSIEMGLSEDNWNSKIVFQVDPVRELPDLCRFLLGYSNQDLVITRSMKDAKSLTLKNQKNGTYIGLYHNKSLDNDNTSSNSQSKDEKFSKILGRNQIFALRVMALSRLAAVYSVTVTDVIEQLRY